MSPAAEAFDIAEVKRASVRFKGALQAEWQDTIQAAKEGQSLSIQAPVTALQADAAARVLPNVNFALKYDVLKHETTEFTAHSPLQVSNWAC